jgi:hypothetical protein
MYTKQISVFIENKPGRLADVAKVLRDGKVNIRTITVADTAEFGIVRMIVNKPDEAQALLKKAGFTVKESTVIAVQVEDREGVFYDLMKLCDVNGLNIEYTYSFVEQTTSKAVLFLRFEDPDKAAGVLQKNGFKLLSDSEMRKM